MVQKNPITGLLGDMGKRACYWFGYVLVCAIAIGCLIGPSYSQAGGKPAPDFLGYTLEGDEVTDEALRGEPALLMFWAPGVACVKENYPNLQISMNQKNPKSSKCSPLVALTRRPTSRNM